MLRNGKIDYVGQFWAAMMECMELGGVRRGGVEGSDMLLFMQLGAAPTEFRWSSVENCDTSLSMILREAPTEALVDAPREAPGKPPLQAHRVLLACLRRSATMDCIQIEKSQCKNRNDDSCEQFCLKCCQGPKLHCSCNT